MNAEGQGFLKAQYSYPGDYAMPSAATPSGALAQQAKTSVVGLAATFEYLWSFYEAMRLGRPLPNADQQLANLGTAMRNLIHRA